jgi:hypothetical protein
VTIFDAEIVPADHGGAYVVVPPAVVAALGGRGRIPVCAWFDGIEYRGYVVSMDNDGMILGVRKDIRTALGKGPGDTVTVTVQLDELARVVTVPDDLRVALDDAGLADTFGALSYSHQREYVTWIDEAKKPETRARRVRQTIERLQT